MVRSTLGAVNPKFSYSSCRSEVLHLASTDITSFQESQTEFLASNLDTPFKLSEPQFTHLQSGGKTLCLGAFRFFMSVLMNVSP